jgi:hypothetical protein
MDTVSSSELRLVLGRAMNKDIQAELLDLKRRDDDTLASSPPASCSRAITK